MGEAAELIAHGRRQLAAGQAMEAAAALASATEIEPVSADVFCDLAIAHHRAAGMVVPEPQRAVEVDELRVPRDVPGRRDCQG